MRRVRQLSEWCVVGCIEQVTEGDTVGVEGGGWVVKE